MSMLRALSILGAGASGYATGRQEFNAEERRKKNDEWLAEERGRTRKQWDEQDAYKSEMQAAATPTPIEATPGPDSSGNFARQDRGQPAEAPPMAYNVGGQAYSDRGMADAAGERARSKRVMDVIARRDPFKAEQLKTEQLQGRAAELQLSEAEKKTVREEHSRHVWEKLMESSGGKPSQQDIEAAFMVSNAPISEVLKYRADREDKAAAQAHNAGMLGVAQQNANSIEQSRKDAAAHARRMEGGNKPKTLSDQFAEIEKVLGRPLREDERLAKVGLGKDKEGDTLGKLTDDLVKEIVKGESAGGTAITPERVSSLRTQILSNLQQDAAAGKSLQPIVTRLREIQATRPNELPAAIAEAKARGMTDDFLKTHGFETTQAKAAPEKKPPGTMARIVDGVPARIGQLMSGGGNGGGNGAAQTPVDAAYQRLLAYGSRQRAADPKGFAAAKAAYEQAKAEEEANAPPAPAGMGPAIRYPRP